MVYIKKKKRKKNPEALFGKAYQTFSEILTRNLTFPIQVHIRNKKSQYSGVLLTCVLLVLPTELKVNLHMKNNGMETDFYIRSLSDNLQIIAVISKVFFLFLIA